MFNIEVKKSILRQKTSFGDLRLWIIQDDEYDKLRSAVDKF